MGSVARGNISAAYLDFVKILTKIHKKKRVLPLFFIVCFIKNKIFRSIFTFFILLCVKYPANWIGGARSVVALGFVFALIVQIPHSRVQALVRTPLFFSG